MEIKNRRQWRTWLEKNHGRNEGIWLVTYKKHHLETYVSYNDIVEEALCFGWIDSLPRKLDKDRTRLWLAPRKAGSGWSKINKEHVDKLIGLDLMQKAGLEKIESARQDGSWNALDKIDSLEIPADLQTALDALPSAALNFNAFPRSVKRGILEWIASAKKADTRSRRVEETARLAKDNIRANQWRQK